MCLLFFWASTDSQRSLSGRYITECQHVALMVFLCVSQVDSCCSFLTTLLVKRIRLSEKSIEQTTLARASQTEYRIKIGNQLKCGFSQYRLQAPPDQRFRSRVFASDSLFWISTDLFAVLGDEQSKCMQVPPHSIPNAHSFIIDLGPSGPSLRKSAVASVPGSACPPVH